MEDKQPVEGNFQEQILARVPGLTTEDVKVLMAKYPNLKALFNASEADLKAIKIIGAKKAKTIVHALAAPFRASVPPSRRPRATSHH